MSEVYKPITINKDNIEITLTEQIISKYDLKQQQLTLIKISLRLVDRTLLVLSTSLIIIGK